MRVSPKSKGDMSFKRPEIILGLDVQQPGPHITLWRAVPRYGEQWPSQAEIMKGQEIVSYIISGCCIFTAQDEVKWLWDFQPPAPK